MLMAEHHSEQYASAIKHLVPREYVHHGDTSDDLERFE